MIFRDRKAVLPPSSLALAGLVEQSQAIVYYGQHPTPNRNMEFLAYKADDVKEALNSLFDGKCAYCEGKYLNHPLDVEHYRPKGEIVVEDRRIFPGYWWLASEWTNLLVSCIDCNRKRYHRCENAPRVLFGKENKFPIFDEDQRAKKSGDEAFERPLLLNPTESDPVKYISFHFETDQSGQPLSLAKAVVGNLVNEERGTQTINILGLNRPSLVRARAEMISKMAFSLKLAYEKLMTQLSYQAPSGSRSTDPLNIFKADIQSIVAMYARRDHQFSAACVSYFRSWISDVTTEFEDTSSAKPAG